ncbi:MAG: UDP-N-acetylglucosamine 1-carboxyvinyltransferase, partial [Aquificaceae bacterium]
KHGYRDMKVKKIKPVEYTFEVITVTGTENALMFLSGCEKRSVLRNIALEPEVMDLVEVLRKMGVEIHIEDRTALIRGSEHLRGFSHRVIPDRIEAGTFMVAGFLTGGDVLLEDVRVEHLGSLIEKLREAGAELELLSLNSLRVRGGKAIQPLSISTAEYPGFPTDMQAQFMVLCCLADGVSEIRENIFENRFQHVAELQRMGADIHVRDRTAIVRGVKKLYGAEVYSTDLRASASLVLAGLVAEGTTLVRDIYHLDRGYEKLEKKLKALGALIERGPHHKD